MPEAKTITVATGRTRTELEVHEIHYVLMKRNYANGAAFAKRGLPLRS